MTRRCICFSHGKESGPWGTKIQALAKLARSADWDVESLDYQGMDDPQARVNKLVAWCNNRTQPYALAGSSMGGHVAAAAASAGVTPLGLYLLAPAFFMPGYEEHTPAYPDCRVSIVHGWRDAIVPWQNSVRFAESGNAQLLLLNSDHSLTDALEEIGSHFLTFLKTLPRVS